MTTRNIASNLSSILLALEVAFSFLLLRTHAFGSNNIAARPTYQIRSSLRIRQHHPLPLDTATSALLAAPEGALSDIVIPSVFTGGLFSKSTLKDEDEDPRVWVPQTDCLSFRPLCFCVSQGYYVNLLKFKGGGVLGCHRHPSPVHALTLKGGWGYKEVR